MQQSQTSADTDTPPRSPPARTTSRKLATPSWPVSRAAWSWTKYGDDLRSHKPAAGIGAVVTTARSLRPDELRFEPGPAR
jgi:hypothetical protein